MNIFLLALLFLFSTAFSSNKIVNETFIPVSLILTKTPSIALNIFYFLTYIDIQNMFKCVGSEPKISKNSIWKTFICHKKNSSPPALKMNSNILSLLHTKKITIYLSKLRKLLLSAPIHFEKRILTFDVHVEYFLSMNENKNTEFLPSEELQNLFAPIYPFFIVHAVRIKTKTGQIGYIILTKEGACHIFSSPLSNIKVCCPSPQISLIHSLSCHGSMAWSSVAIPQRRNIYQNFGSMYFCLDHQKQYLYLFLRNHHRFHLFINWNAGKDNPAISNPRNCSQLYLGPNMRQLEHVSNDGKGYYLFDTKSKVLYQEFHDFTKEGKFLGNVKIYTKIKDENELKKFIAQK